MLEKTAVEVIELQEEKCRVLEWEITEMLPKTTLKFNIIGAFKADEKSRRKVLVDKNLLVQKSIKIDKIDSHIYFLKILHT